MSVVVRMEMPENCECCPMCFTADVPDYHWCAALEQEVEEGLGRPSECPIVCSIPENHGALVDGDKLKHASTDGRKWCDPCPVWGEIYGAEAIVPAERREE